MAQDPVSTLKRKKTSSSFANADKHGDDQPVTSPFEDLESTPRPSASSFIAGPSFPPPVSLHRNTSISSSTSPSKSSSTSRRKSPVKKAPDTVLRPRPIVTAPFERSERKLPPGLKEMVVMFRKIWRASGVISEVQKDNIAVADPESFQNFEDRFFASDADRSVFGPTPDPGEVLAVVEQAIECVSTGHSEASWNCAVHAPLLNLALRNPQYRKQVLHLNCTTAQIQPRSLLRTGTADSSFQSESKMVDFSIVFQPDDTAIQVMREILPRTSDCATLSVNHTWYTPLIARPIAVSIETKRPGEGWDEAILQLGVWVSAQFARLDELVSLSNAAANMIPFLPLLLVQGQDWSFLAASRGEKGETIIWYKVTFGSTTTLLETYQVIAGIQYLAHWIKYTYRPWFLENALGLQPIDQESK